MFGSNPRLKIARPIDGMRSTENRLHPVASSSSISPAFSSVAPGIFSRPSRNRADASISGFTSCGDLYSGPSSRNSTRSMARIARRITKWAKSRGFSPTVVSLHCWRSSETFAGSPATTRARDGSRLRMRRLQDLGRPVGVAPRDQRDHLGAGGQTTRHPEDPHGNHAAVLVGFEFLDEPGQHARRRLAVGKLQHVDVGFGMLTLLLLQPVAQQLSFGRRRHRRQHQRVVGGGEAGHRVGGGHGRPFFAGAFLPVPSWRSPSWPLPLRAAFLAAFFGAAFFAAAFFAAAFFAAPSWPCSSVARTARSSEPTRAASLSACPGRADAPRRSCPTGSARSSRRRVSAGTPPRRPCRD